VLRIAEDWIAHWRASGRYGTEMIGLGGNIVRLVVLAGGIFLFLALWKINITPLLASAGIAGVAVALAAKETLSNFFGGITVLLDQPYRVGDYIILDSGERGEVVEIGLRSTRIVTRDDVQVSIPNSIITNTKVINESAPEPRFRVRIKVGVAYGTDVDQVEDILLNVARNNPHVSPQPEPRVRFRVFGDSSLDFELLCWAHRPHDKGRIIHELNREIYKSFGQAGIVIPFPQRDVHVHSHSA
jgi:small-conductance mechanosensitive channel